MTSVILLVTALFMSVVGLSIGRDAILGEKVSDRVAAFLAAFMSLTLAVGLWWILWGLYQS